MGAEDEWARSLNKILDKIKIQQRDFFVRIYHS